MGQSRPQALVVGPALVLLLALTLTILHPSAKLFAQEGTVPLAETPTEQPTEPPTATAEPTTTAEPTATSLPTVTTEPTVIASPTAQEPDPTATPAPPAPVSIPEPFTIVLFGSGLAALSAAAARRKQQK